MAEAAGNGKVMAMGEAVSSYISYICLGSELWAEAIICCWAVAVKW